MSFRQPNEDLFETSRMSFGEHLEELRRVLVRALIGVAIAAVIGFIFAEETIQILKQPLVDAIGDYQLEDASNALVDRYGFVPPEYGAWMKEGHVPRQFKIDPEQLKTLLGIKTDAVNLAAYRFRVDQFNSQDLPEVCQRLSTQPPAKLATPEKLKAIWDHIPEADQAVITRIAALSSTDDADTAAVADVFNQLLDVKTLSDAKAFEVDLGEPASGFWAIFSPSKPSPLVKLKEKLTAEPNDALNRRLNRALIASQLIDLMPPYKTDLTTIEIWEHGDFQPQALGVGEGFSVWLKAGLFSGLVIAGPWVFWQIWMFVGSGLYPHEKKHMHVFLPISILLFVAGVLLAFYFVFQPVLGFLFSFNRSMGIAPQMRINDWLSFVMFLPLGFGIAFQLPLVMLFMNRIGLFTVEAYMSKWRVAVVVIFVIAMLLTPADPISMLLLAIPLTFLYFLGVGMCRWMPGASNPFGEEATATSSS
ncbi:MAG: sec-independent protein translocase protein TatC [Mariniblastus sp.]|jgi:sec-independent protein translocase protein TatC